MPALRSLLIQVQPVAPEDEGTIFFRNVRSYLPVIVPQRPRRRQISFNMNA
jgi:hypothetical protein